MLMAIVLFGYSASKSFIVNFINLHCIDLLTCSIHFSHVIVLYWNLVVPKESLTVYYNYNQYWIVGW